MNISSFSNGLRSLAVAATMAVVGAPTVMAETLKIEHSSGVTEVEKNPKTVLVYDFGMLETLTKRALAKPMRIVVATALEPAEIESRGGLPPGVSVFHKPVPYTQLIKLAGAYREIWAINENTISV